MPSHAVQAATTFLGDAAALMNGFAGIVTHIVMAPIERIANASDVAGILATRKAGRARRHGGGQPGSKGAHGPKRGRGSRRRGGVFGCLGFLGDLT
jgi:hypothetical protein